MSQNLIMCENSHKFMIRNKTISIERAHFMDMYLGYRFWIFGETTTFFPDFRRLANHVIISRKSGAPHEIQDEPQAQGGNAGQGDEAAWQGRRGYAEREDGRGEVDYAEWEILSVTAATGILALIALAEFVFILVPRIRMRALNDRVLVYQAQVSRFDHDGDGRVGGSVKKSRFDDRTIETAWEASRNQNALGSKT